MVVHKRAQVHMMPPCETCIRSSRSRLHYFVTGLLLSLSLSASDGMTSFNVPYRCMGAPPLNGERYILAIGKTSHMPACMACIQTSSTCIYMLPPAPIELQQTADDSSLSRSSQPKADPQHNTEPASANNVKTAPSGMKASNGLPEQQAVQAGRNSVSEEQLHAANKSSFPNGTTDTKWRRDLTYS